MLGCVFVLKLGVLVQLRDNPLIQPDAGLDTTAYVTLASKVLAGNVALGPGLYYVSPFYIYFLAAILALWHSFAVVRVVQIALGTGTVFCVYLMARTWFGEIAAWSAAALAGMTGLFTFFEVLILQSSIDAFLSAAALCCLTLALAQPVDARPPSRAHSHRSGAHSHRLMLACGVLFGIATLNRPNMLIGAVGVLAALAATKRLAAAALLLTGIVAGMAPVAIRNVVVAHQFSFVSSHGGLNFYIGNGEDATGYYRQVAGVTPNIEGQQTDVVRVASTALGRRVTDSEASTYFYDLAWTWMREHPISTIGLFLRKLYYTFQAQFIPLPHSYPFFVRDEHTMLRFLPIGPWLLIPLGLTGLVLGRALTKPYIVWLMFVPAYAIAVAVFFVAERYRLPLLVALTVGAGGAIQFAAHAVRKRRVASIVLLAALLVPVAVAANWPLQRDDGRWIEGLRLAQRLLILGRTSEADALMPRLRPLEPHPGATEYGYGAQLLDLNRPAAAVPLLERAHSLDPKEPSIDFALGRALLKVGRARDALPHLQRGFDAGVPLPQGGIDYPAALLDVGAYADTVAALRRIAPGDDPDACLRMGRMAVEAKAPEVAEPFFRHALQLRPDASAHQQLGLDLLVQSKFDEAARELGEAARLDPQDVDTLSRLAYCEVKLGRLDEARAHVAQALAVNPSDPLAQQLSQALGIRH